MPLTVEYVVLFFPHNITRVTGNDNGTKNLMFKSERSLIVF